jgi:hypothetical protein
MLAYRHLLLYFVSNVLISHHGPLNIVYPLPEIGVCEMSRSDNHGNGKPDKNPGQGNKPDTPPGRPDNVPPPKPSKPADHRPVGMV